MSLLSTAAVKLARWHFAIATAFEGVKYAHQLGLYLYLSASEYGLIGSIFSLAYLSAHLSGFEQGNAMAPHTGVIATNPNRSLYIKKNILLPQIIQHTTGSLIIGFISYKIGHTTPIAYAAIIISFCEGIRTNLRPLIYAASGKHLIAKNETLIAYTYIAALWLIKGLAPIAFTSTTIIQLYAITSVAGCLYLLYAGYQTLIAHSINDTPEPIPSQIVIIKTQIALIITHLPHNLFSANFLVPFFAYHTGLALAGTLKIASEIASAIKTIIKSSIGFPLNALLISMPISATQNEREIAFTAIKKTIQQTTTILIVTSAAGVGILLIPLSFYTKAIFISFYILIITDYLCMPYELLSVHNGTIGAVARIRLIEVIFDLVLIKLLYQWPLIAIGGISFVRLITWKILAEGWLRPALFFAALWSALKNKSIQ